MPEWMIITGAVAGWITTWMGLIVAVVLGVRRFQRWTEAALIEPHIKPIQDDIRSMRQSQEQDRKMLLDHDKYIYLLLGKQLGGIPQLGNDPPQEQIR